LTTQTVLIVGVFFAIVYLCNYFHHYPPGQWPRKICFLILMIRTYYY
jgi:hypothetical protein